MKSPNFLSYFSHNQLKKTHVLGVSFIIIIMTAALLLFWDIYPLAIIFLIGLVGISTFALKPEWGLYSVLFLGLFHGWVIDFSTYQSVKHIPYLPQINAPLVDFFAIVLFIGVFLLYLFQFQKLAILKRLRHIKTGIVIYILFLITALAAVFFAFNNFFTPSIKYFMRPLVFVFVLYWLLPIILIRTKKQFSSVMKLWFWTGIGIAIFGLISLFVLGQTGWIRVVPFGIKGFAPLGYNHNQLAEVLISLFPAGLFLFLRSFSKEEKRLYGFGTFFIIIIALLTLSRAAWAAVLVQVGFLFWFFRSAVRPFMYKFQKITTLLLIAIIPAILYMSVFLGSSIVKSSTNARVEATKIALFYTVRSPVVGYGPGMFGYVMDDTFLYTLEFGESLDAHGFIQKVMLEEGFLGLLFFVGFLGWILWYIYQAREHGMQRDLVEVLFVMAIGAIIFQLFNTSYFNSVMWLPLGVATAGTLLLKNDS